MPARQAVVVALPAIAEREERGAAFGGEGFVAFARMMRVAARMLGFQAQVEGRGAGAPFGRERSGGAGAGDQQAAAE